MGNSQVLFEYNNRFLKPFRKEHIFLLKDWRNAQMAILRQYKPLTDNHQKKWFIAMKKDKSQTLFALYERKDGTGLYIGYCGITHIDARNKRGEISFIVDPKRTKNLSLYKKDFIAVLAMLSYYGFERLRLHKLFTDTFEFRKNHIKILEVFGLRKEGTLRQHYFGKGKYFNSFIHSILKDEWTRIKKKYEFKK